MELTEAPYIIVKGFIDAKDDRGKATYGALVALVNRRDVKFTSVLFSSEEIPKDTEWDELLRRRAVKSKDQNRDSSEVRNEESLDDFLYQNNVLSAIVKNHNAKPAEQAVSRFCLDRLQLKAVSFLDFLDATDSDVDYIESFSANEGGGEGERENEGDSKQSPQGEEGGEPAGPSEKFSPNEIFVKCDPVLDPIFGVAMNELRIGEAVYAKLPEDSVFFKLLSKNYSAFDGMINAEVTGILLNDLGTATISLKLSDDVFGIMKLSGKVKIRVVNPEGVLGTTVRRARSFRFANLPTEVVIGFCCGVLLISAIFAAYYIAYW